MRDDLRGEPMDMGVLSERVARLESEVGSLRGDLTALQKSRLADGRTGAVLDAKEREGLAAQAAASEAVGSGFARGRESLESRVGTAVLSKISVVLLLVGVAWFLKWAFDNRWIGPVGRVAAGLLAGAGVIVWSERFRRQQLVGFSYALKAVGSGVLYLGLWASVQLYHIGPPLVAFAAMVAVTAWNAAIAWSQDAQLLGGYALLGAYLTPLLLRTGGDHEMFLFSYLAAIAAALLVLLRLKPWCPLLLGALPATAGFYIAWYTEFFDAPKAWRTVGFGLLLWAIFTVVPLLAMEAESVIVAVLEPLGAGLFGSLTIYSVLVDSGGSEWEFWCALGFALMYFALASWARWQSRGRAAAVHWLLGVAFVTTAITLKATGREITVGWLLETITLLVIGFWRRTALARWTGLVLLAVTLVKLLVYDMRNLGTGYRVLSYLGLGVLLMAVSFAYQKDWLGLARTERREQSKPASNEANA